MKTVSWSYTTVNTLRQCNRKFYFYNVLASHGRKVPVRRKAYELKSMQNLKMWAGSVVDKFMELTIIPAIREKKELDFSVLAEKAVQMAQLQFRFSKNALYTDPSQKKGDLDGVFCILNIHEVNATYTEQELAETYADIRQAVLNLPAVRMPDGKLLVDFLKECNSLTPNVNNWVATIEKALINPQMDLLALHQWKPVVMDWKLSASFTSDYSRQLLICGLTVFLKRLESGKPAYDYSDIRLYEVNLLKSEVKPHELTEDRSNELINYINLTAEDIHLLTNDDEPDIDEFELTDDEGLCKSCNFQTLCSFLLKNKNQYDEKLYSQFIQASQSV